jgi:hypothetical protein
MSSQHKHILYYNFKMVVQPFSKDVQVLVKLQGFGSTRFRNRPASGISKWIESGRPGAEEGQKGRDPIDPR